MLKSLMAFTGGSALVASLLGGVQSESLLFLWIMMELNLVGFLLFSGSGGVSGSYLLKYFLVQSVGSAGMVLSVLMSGVTISTLGGSLLFLSLSLKLGAAPLHSWFIGLMAESPWGVLVVLSFPQKALPLLGFYYFGWSVSALILLSALVGVIGSLGTNSVKSLLAYSSVFGLGWALMVYRLPEIWLGFLMVYTLGLLCFITPLLGGGGEGVSVENMWARPDLVGTGSAIFGGLSMAGFPPTPGFIMKIQVAGASVGAGMASSLAILIISSVVILNMYLSVLSQLFSGPRYQGVTPAWASGPWWPALLSLSGLGLYWVFMVGVTAQEILIF